MVDLYLDLTLLIPFSIDALNKVLRRLGKIAFLFELNLSVDTL